MSAGAQVGGLRAVLRNPFQVVGAPGNSDPAVHPGWFTGDGFAWDIYGPPGAAVRPRFVSSDGPVSLVVEYVQATCFAGAGAV